MIHRRILSWSCITVLVLFNLTTFGLILTEAAQAGALATLIRDILTRRRPQIPRSPGGGRDLFQVFPNRSTTQVWHNRPMLIWRNKGAIVDAPDRFQLLEAGTHKVLWDDAISSEPFGAIQISVTLHPGKQYRLRSLKNGIQTGPDTEFQVLPHAQRLLLERDFVRLQDKLRSQGADPSKLLAAQTEFWIEKGLWWDALQVVQSSNLQVAEREAATQEILKYWDAQK
jgi:hypothetical protein